MIADANGTASRNKGHSTCQNQQTSFGGDQAPTKHEMPSVQFGIQNQSGLFSSYKGKTSKNSLFSTTFPHPVSKIDRTKAPEPEESLRFPISPAFVNNYSLAKQPKLKPIVDFCQQKNIPFKIEESRFYKINQAR